jgi:carboxypeptidase Taq
MTAFRQLSETFRRLAVLGDAAGVLHWDASTMMPPGGAGQRGEEVSLLERMAHDMLVAPETADLLDAAEAEADALDETDRVDLGWMRWRHTHASALPGDLVEAASKAGSRCETLWRTARAESDFSQVADALAEVVGLTREKAAIKAGALGLGTYDALLDGFDPGRRSTDIDGLFGELEAFLPDLLAGILERQEASPPPLMPSVSTPVSAQRAFARRLVEIIGFDFERGRLDESLHPFTGGAGDDVRITTRFAEHSPVDGLMGVVHETGHALYEQGLPTELRYRPVGESLGMTIHESQSLLLEMQAGRSSEFMELLAPMFRDAFGADPAWTRENLSRLYLRVEPSLIRVEADEVTYPLHIILRYRLEQALLTGDLQIPDLPAAWNDGMADLLGIRPENDAQGCLQDIHWYDGAFGYFPTYTLGALTAAQMFSAATHADPTILPGIAAGDFSPLFRWLRPNVHEIGRRLGPDALIERATGTPLGTDAFRRHLERRYLAPA